MYLITQFWGLQGFKGYMIKCCIKERNLDRTNEQEIDLGQGKRNKGGTVN